MPQQRQHRGGSHIVNAASTLAIPLALFGAKEVVKSTRPLKSVASSSSAKSAPATRTDKTKTKSKPKTKSASGRKYGGGSLGSESLTTSFRGLASEISRFLTAK